MFSRAPKQTRFETLIGRSVRIEGGVQFEGGLHLDGTIIGDVRAGDSPQATLSVSESGAIEGSVEVANIILAGTVRGDIRAHGRVVLAATARVEGNVRYGVIELTLGAHIMGKLTRTSPEPAGQPAA